MFGDKLHLVFTVMKLLEAILAQPVFQRIVMS